MGTYDFDNLSKDDLKKLVESLEKSDVPIFLAEPDSNRIIFANRAWISSAGRLHDNFTNGVPMDQALQIETDAILPALPEEVRKSIASEFSNAICHGGEFDFGGPDGRLYRGKYAKTDETTTLGISFDVTEIKQRRDEVKKTRKSLESTLEGLHHGVLLYDETGHVSYFNESFRATSESIGVQVKKGMFHRDVREQLPQSILDLLQNGDREELDDFDFIQQAPSGKHYLFEGRRLSNNSVLISTVDVTELQKNRAAARKTQETLEKSLEGLPHGVLLYDMAGVVQLFNSEFERAVRPMDMHVEKGMSYKELSAQIPRSFRQELHGKEAGQPFELIQKRVDGRSYLIEGHPIEGVGFLITSVDITELQDALEAAKAADIAKSSFLANMSHEIRTPMNGVLGMAQVLEQTTVDDHQQKCIEIIKSSSEMLLRIINDILDISKLDAEKIDIEQEPIDIETCVNRAIDIVRPKSHENSKIEIINDFNKPANDAYLGDAGRIRQVLINLISNGIKFTEQGHIKISTRFEPVGDDQDKIIFRVEDTGIGISPEKYAKVFERFEQSDNSTTRKYGGTGLGLAISRRLARLMQGDLKICTNYTDGACFEFSMVARRTNARTNSTTPTIRSFNKLPVLIIDDNPINHMVITNQLKPLRVKPYCVTSASQGLAILKRTAAKNVKIPLVICDYQMPGQTGYEFAQQLKSDPMIADTPIMILSSADILSRKKDFTDLGVDVVLEKPCSNAEIVASVSDLLFKSIQQKVVPIEAPTPTPTLVSKNNRRILVADDDPVNREVFRGLLALTDQEAHIVDNGLEALQAYCKNPFDLVIMDISMPVLGGTAATEKIRKFEEQNNLLRAPIIAVTAHALKGDKEKFLACGMDDYLPKPILRADFEKVVQKWLDQSRRSSRLTAAAS